MSKVIVNTKLEKGTINKNIYGHFSEHLGRCIYGGIYVGEGSPIPNINGYRKDVLEALRKIRVPVLRWPGGCFADEYHWKDGIGPKSDRKKMINTHWGGVVEDNSFGTHEFLEFCELLGCEPYINMNVGSGTVQEMSEWVEYLNSDAVSPMSNLRRQNGKEEPWGVKYIGVGNENWGCGGNMTAQFYADQYRRYGTYVRTYGENVPFKIACGPSEDDYKWMKVLMEQVPDRPRGNFMSGITMHMYTRPGEHWGVKGSATEFSTDEYYKTICKSRKIEEMISNHKAIMKYYDPENKVGLIVDEWGSWYDVEPGTNPRFLYQQNTMRDAVLAASTLNIFNENCDRIIMANIAQMVNVLQAVILTEGDQMVKTPTYHVFDLYKGHQDATLLDSYAETELIGTEEYKIPDLSLSASRNGNGEILVTMTNMSAEKDLPIDLSVTGCEVGFSGAEILHGDIHEKNTFEDPEAVSIKELTGIRECPDGCSFILPACSVASVVLKEKK